MGSHTSSVSLLASLFSAKAWANQELLSLMATVQTDTPERQQLLHSAVRLLNHIYVVDRIFQAHLSGEAHGYSNTNTKDTPTLSELSEAVQQCDTWYQTFIEQQSDETLGTAVPFQFTDGDTGCMTQAEILMHIITHGGYHRGNVGQILKGLQVAPPRDLYTKFLHLREPQRRQGKL